MLTRRLVITACRRTSSTATTTDTHRVDTIREAHTRVKHLPHPISQALSSTANTDSRLSLTISTAVNRTHRAMANLHLQASTGSLMINTVNHRAAMEIIKARHRASITAAVSPVPREAMVSTIKVGMVSQADNSMVGGTEVHHMSTVSTTKVTMGVQDRKEDLADTTEVLRRADMVEADTDSSKEAAAMAVLHLLRGDDKIVDRAPKMATPLSVCRAGLHSTGWEL